MDSANGSGGGAIGEAFKLRRLYRHRGYTRVTTPTIFTAPKKLAATAAWLAEPPSSLGFSSVGVLMESKAVEPTINTLII